MSIRKPHNEESGYIASLRSGQNRGWVVIYEAAAQGIRYLRYSVRRRVSDT